MRFFSSLVAWPSRWVLARSQSFACSQAVRQALDLLGVEAALAAVGGEIGLVQGGGLEDGGELVARGPTFGPASASGRSRPLLRASRRQACSVASEIPSSLASCRKGTAFGGSSFFRTAARRSVE
jgi:hypothetical protein